MAPSGGVEGAPLMGAAALCVHLFRAISDMISIHCAFSIAQTRAESVTREGVVLSVTIDAVAFPTETMGSDFLRGCKQLAILHLPLLGETKVRLLAAYVYRLSRDEGHDEREDDDKQERGHERE